MDLLFLFEVALYTLTILSCSLILGVSVFRRPFNSTKLTFSLFGTLLTIWNFYEIFSLFQEKPKEMSRIVLAVSTIYLMNVFALNFPYYNRRRNYLTYYVVFLGGVGFSVLATTFLTPLLPDHSEILDFHFRIVNVISNLFNGLGIFSFVFITLIKLSNAVRQLRKVLIKGLLLFVCMILILIGWIIYFQVPPKNLSIGIKTIDIFFLLCVVLVFSQFSFLSFYPGILSIFLYGEIPRLVIQKEAPATGKGASYLKNELWKIYEVENWESFLSEFWFSLIIDETIDNALEHGGKRIDDKITVQIFETKNFLDIYVADMGKGFDPSQVPDPSLPERKNIPTGRGIHILKKLFPVAWNYLGNEIRVRVSKNPMDNPKDD